MSDEGAEDKTEEPTGKRLSTARQEGNIAQTPEARILASLVAGMILVGMLAPMMARQLKALMTPLIERPHEFAVDPGALARLSLDLAIGVGKVMAWPLILVVVLGVSLSLAQTKGFMWVPKKLMPSFDKINPLQGVKRLFSVNQVVELGKALIKLTLIGSLLFWTTWKHLSEYQNLATIGLEDLLAYLRDQIYWLTFVTVLAVAVIAAADYLFQRWRWMEKMRMSKQEVKDEHKQQEGDPQVKARIRSLRIQRARKRMMAAVPQADVVVTNPTHYAVALKYDSETMNAPTLVAKGADLIAKRIRDLATENDVPIVENPPLARALYAAVELDQEVPPEHYKTVAEVIGYVMRLKGQRAN
ncbi:MAG TPA: flagellar biosynthesis protein FlhB [Magnetospirillum sp.]|nr:flagellar biosynthesis protein FlhB [Magnetospirillum sp.]